MRGWKEGGKMMGQHKYNPRSALAKENKLPLKPAKISKREQERQMRQMIENKLGIGWIHTFIGGRYYG
jgi:hypothetical protein